MVMRNLQVVNLYYLDPAHINESPHSLAYSYASVRNDSTFLCGVGKGHTEVMLRLSKHRSERVGLNSHCAPRSPKGEGPSHELHS